MGFLRTLINDFDFLKTEKQKESIFKALLGFCQKITMDKIVDRFLTDFRQGLKYPPGLALTLLTPQYLSLLYCNLFHKDFIDRLQIYELDVDIKHFEIYSFLFVKHFIELALWDSQGYQNIISNFQELSSVKQFYSFFSKYFSVIG